jgi:hypothetical protein
MKLVHSSLILSIPFLVAMSGCATPTEPTREPVQSFAEPAAAFTGATPPDFSGTWRGQYLLRGCRAVTSYACKDFPRQTQVSLQLVQTGAVLAGTIEIEGRRSEFQGIVTSALALAGRDTGNVSARLSLSDGRLSGYFVSDTYHADGSLYMSKRFDVVVPLTRE